MPKNDHATVKLGAEVAGKRVEAGEATRVREGDRVAIGGSTYLAKRVGAPHLLPSAALLQ